MNIVHIAIGTAVNFKYAPRDERGLSQSTENALLLAGAAAIALMLVVFISDFVKDRLPTEKF